MYEYLDHTADMGIRAVGRDLAEALAEVARGMLHLQVPPGGAADLAGLRVDDVIIGINGTSVRELDYETIVERLRGPAGSSVQLDVFRYA